MRRYLPRTSALRERVGPPFSIPDTIKKHNSCSEGVALTACFSARDIHTATTFTARHTLSHLRWAVRACNRPGRQRQGPSASTVPHIAFNDGGRRACHTPRTQTSLVSFCSTPKRASSSIRSRHASRGGKNLVDVKKSLLLVLHAQLNTGHASDIFS